MKKLLLLTFLIQGLFLFSQSPQQINYQGLARDAMGVPVTSLSTIGLQFIITNSANIAVHTESQPSVPINNLGLFNTKIGLLPAISNTITWQNGPYKLAVSINLGNGLVPLGTQELVSVPYALYAEKSGATVSQSLAINGNSLSITGGNTVTLPSGTVGAIPNTSITGSGIASITAIGTNSFDVFVPQTNITGVGEVTVAGTFPNFTVSTSTLSAGWSLIGNPGTNSLTNFIGTTDNTAFGIRVNNISSGVIDPAGPTFFGFQAGAANSFQAITGFGHEALFSNTTGQVNSALGWDALRANSTGSSNSAFGCASLKFNVTGNNNTAMGWVSLFQNTLGNGNTAIGTEALRDNSTGNNNSALGFQAMFSNTFGNFNTANGAGALYANTNGSHNSANGYAALYSNSTGSFNTAGGYSSIYNNIGGNNNTAFGYQSLYSNTTGGQNTNIGAYTGFNNSSGVGNVFLGYQAGYNEAGSNKLYIANSNVNPPLIYGDFSTGFVGLGEIVPTTKLHVSGLSQSNILNAFSGAPQTAIRIHNEDLTNGNFESLIFSTRSTGASFYESAKIVGHNTNHSSGSIAGELVFFTRSPANLNEVMRINSVGNVGIGVASPVQRLDVAGNVQIPGANEYLYNSPKQKYLSAHVSGLTAIRPQFYNFYMDTYVLGYDGDSGYGYFNNGVPTTSAAATVPVYLPDGATVTELWVRYYDSDATYNLTISLERKAHNTINNATMASATSAGSGSTPSSMVTQTIVAITTPVIDNLNNAYYIKFKATQANANLGVADIRIGYTIIKTD